VRIHLLCFAMLVTCAAAQADEPRFSLEIHSGGHPQLDVAAEARKALWEDPMARLMRAADAEFGHLLIGQPGARTPPVIVVGFRPGVAPHIIGASIESNLASRTVVHSVTIPWPWISEHADEELSLEQGFAVDLANRLATSFATARP
jgi:hypothetical protein